MALCFLVRQEESTAKLGPSADIAAQGACAVSSGKSRLRNGKVAPIEATAWRGLLLSAQGLATCGASACGGAYGARRPCCMIRSPAHRSAPALPPAFDARFGPALGVRGFPAQGSHRRTGQHPGCAQRRSRETAIPRKGSGRRVTQGRFSSKLGKASKRPRTGD